MSGIQIKSFGSYAPPNIVDNEALSGIVDTNDQWIFSRTGIKKRHISDGENTSDICIGAAEQILKKAGVSPEEVGAIIVATLSPDYATPATACMVQGAIGAKNAFAFDMNAACSGFIYGLSVAEKIMRSGCNNVLVLGAETLSKLVDWEDRSTCVLFADGGGGALLSHGDYEAFLGEDIHSDGTRGMCLTAGLTATNSPFWKTEEHYPYIKMDGREIFEFALRAVPASISTAAERAGVSFDEIKYFVLHQANSRILEGISKKLKVDIKKFYMNMDEYGNTSAGSIPLALAEMNAKGLITPGSGEKIVLSGFGGGLTWGSIIINL